MFDVADMIGQLFLLAESPALERYVERSYSRAVVTGFLNEEESEPVRRVIGRLRDYLAKNPTGAIRVSVAGADYAIYFLYRFREEFQETGDVARALQATIQTSGRAVLFVAPAISAGFTINIPSDFYQLRLLGGFVPATMIVSCLTSLSLFPALVLVLRPRFIFGRARSSGQHGQVEEG